MSASRSSDVGVGRGAIADADADARAEVELAALVENGWASAASTRSATADAVLLVGVVAQDRELVAAEARDGVLGARRFAQALGRLREHHVAGLVAQRVVDELEAVEVDEQHR